MYILRAGAHAVATLIAQTRAQTGQNYRLSLYAWPHAFGDRRLLLHTMTREVLELTAAEWAALSRFRDAPGPYERLVQSGLRTLAEKRYLVEEDCDEARMYAQTLFLLKTMQGRKSGNSGYTILPTTGCNARCVYCYEAGMAVRTMTEATADRLADFICETKREGPAKLRWFGGEPLVASSVIRRVCAALERRGVDFDSGMVTNASLLTPDLVREARERWHLGEVQVSLDGAREDYALRKRYAQPDKYNYDGVMLAIRDLAELDIRVRLRVNVDADNLRRLDGFLEEMAGRFGGMHAVSLYLAPLFQAQAGDDCAALLQAVFALRGKIRALGLAPADGGQKKSALRLRHCMADDMENSVVVSPEGLLYSCEHLPGQKPWGNIFDGVTDPALYASAHSPREIDPQCAVCPFLPRCTPFYRRGCPDWSPSCQLWARLETEEELRRLLRGAEADGDAAVL